MIRTVIRLRNGAVFVFDEDGEQVPGFQGQNDLVREGILREARESAVFHRVLPGGRLGEVPREEW